MTQHSGHAHAGDHPEPNYMGVFIALFVLTVVEVGVVFMPIPIMAIRGMLVLLAFTKAIMVAAYFMHLKFENRTLALIAATPIVLCIGLMFALLPDAERGREQAPPAATSTAAPASHP